MNWVLFSLITNNNLVNKFNLQQTLQKLIIDVLIDFKSFKYLIYIAYYFYYKVYLKQIYKHSYPFHFDLN